MLHIYKHSGIYTLEVKQSLPIDLESAWDFFSKPNNLERITPNEMGFKITSKLSQEMYAGQIITYKIGLLPFVKSNWVTEITQVKNHEFFIDEQRFGPYKMWHHEHRFEIEKNGVLVTDKISYKIPFGFIGRLAHGLFIRKKLIQIFTYRKSVLEKRFKE